MCILHCDAFCKTLAHAVLTNESGGTAHYHYCCILSFLPYQDLSYLPQVPISGAYRPVLTAYRFPI
jgi:hypothetical protein